MFLVFPNSTLRDCNNFWLMYLANYMSLYLLFYDVLVVDDLAKYNDTAVLNSLIMSRKALKMFFLNLY